MIKNAGPGSLARAFSGSVNPPNLQAVLIQQAMERDRRERKEAFEQNETEFMDFAMTMVAATEIDGFRLEIDAYDAAAVSALYENEHRLALARTELGDLFAKAHVLPDGRHVFKTEDGVRVFDEHGQELALDVIDPDAIADERPRWEAVKPKIDAHDALVKERDEIIRYQGKLDDARERLDKGDISRTEFDAMREDLKEAMPDAVRDQLPGSAVERKLEREPSAAMADADLDLTDDMVPSAMKLSM